MTTSKVNAGEGDSLPGSFMSTTGDELAELAVSLREWIEVPENYSVIHFAIENKMSKEELIRLAGESKELGDALDYAFSVQEYKVTEGALTGVLDRTVSLKMLETYSGWKSDVNILQKNEFKQYMNEAERKAQAILGRSTCNEERLSEDFSEEDDGQ